ncbi:MAG: 30S ribosomal protein S17, partial [bacterium]|nr:30S ribosomal protein S17 [bacterium]
MIGRVVSVKMQKTAVVRVESRKTHPLYKKSYVWSKKYLADDPIGVVLGDVVEIVKVAPISKRKHFRITKVTGKDFVALGEEHLQKKVEEAIAEVLPDLPADATTLQAGEVEEEESVKGEGESKQEEVEKAKEPKVKKEAKGKKIEEKKEV